MQGLCGWSMGLRGCKLLTGSIEFVSSCSGLHESGGTPLPSHQPLPAAPRKDAGPSACSVHADKRAINCSRSACICSQTVVQSEPG